MLLWVSVIVFEEVLHDEDDDEHQEDCSVGSLLNSCLESGRSRVGAGMVHAKVEVEGEQVFAFRNTVQHIVYATS